MPANESCHHQCLCVFAHEGDSSQGGHMNNSSFLDRVFHLAENGTTVKTEILAGITTFMTMAYILAVNPIFMGSI